MSKKREEQLSGEKERAIKKYEYTIKKTSSNNYVDVASYS